MQDTWARKLADFIQHEVSRNPRKSIETDTPLISSGLIDSFSLIRVLAFVEDEFGIVIPDEAATAEAMNSVTLIILLMSTYASDSR